MSVQLIVWSKKFFLTYTTIETIHINKSVNY